MAEFLPIYLPQSGPNDVTATLVEWAKEAGHWVNAGEVVAVAETTKSVFDIEAPRAGYLFPLVQSGSEAAVGAVIAAISLEAASADAVQGWLAERQAPQQQPPPPAADGDLKPATKKAELLAQRHGVDLALVPAFGDRITEADVLAYVEGGAKGEGQRRRPALFGKALDLGRCRIPQDPTTPPPHKIPAISSTTAIPPTASSACSSSAAATARCRSSTH